MKCNTVRPGVECIFMTASGCSFEGGSCRPITEECAGCEHVTKYRGEEYCSVYAMPEWQWSIGVCSHATHRRVSRLTGEVLSSNPLKASKRSTRRR